jgi:predicted nucleic acid-binding Zn ribbon protein
MSKKKYVYTYNKKCEVCTKDFQTQRYGTKICSPECVSIKLSQKRKYTDSQVELAIALRLQGVIIPEIVKQTGIKKPSLQKIFQEKDIRRRQKRCFSPTLD